MPPFDKGAVLTDSLLEGDGKQPTGHGRACDTAPRDAGLTLGLWRAEVALTPCPHSLLEGEGKQPAGHGKALEVRFTMGLERDELSHLLAGQPLPAALTVSGMHTRVLQETKHSELLRYPTSRRLDRTPRCFR